MLYPYDPNVDDVLKVERFTQGPLLTFSAEGLKIDCTGATKMELLVPWPQINQMEKRFHVKGAK